MIPSYLIKVTYQGNGLTREFPCQWPFHEKAHVRVILVSPAGVERTLTRDYFVDMVKGSVLYPGYPPGEEPPVSEQPPALPAGWKLVLYRELPPTQEVDLGERWPFPIIERIADKLTMLIQQLWEKVGRAVVFPVSEDFNGELPSPIQPGAAIVINEDGTGIGYSNRVFKGDEGWSPILAVIIDPLNSQKEVLRIADWTGGTGIKPAAGQYLGASGLVGTIAEAINIKGGITPEAQAIFLEMIAIRDSIPDMVNDIIDDRFEVLHDEVTKEIDAGDYLNYKPKIGYGEDDCYAPLLGSFDFSARANGAVYAITDNQAREVVYYSGFDGASGQSRVYLGYRMNDEQNFAFLPSPVAPAHLGANEVMDAVLGLGNNHIFYTVKNTATNAQKSYFANTRGSTKPADWTGTIETTAVIAPANLANLAPVYFENEGVIGVVSTPTSGYATTIALALYNAKTLAVIKAPFNIADFSSIIDYTVFSSISSRYSRGRLAAYYNPVDGQLNIFKPWVILGAKIGEGTMYRDGTLYLPYKLPAGFITTGSGTPALQLTPVTDYNFTAPCRGVFLTSSIASIGWGWGWGAGWGAKDLSISVDDFKGVIYFNCTQQSTSNLHFHRLPNPGPSPKTMIGWLEGRQVYLNFQPPDAAPWAKEVGPKTMFMEGQLYCRGVSVSYGTVYFATDLENAVLPGNYTKFKDNAWWITKNEEENTNQFFTPNFLYYRLSSSATKYYTHNGVGSTVQEVIVSGNFTGSDGKTYRGRRTIQDTGVVIPTPSDKYRLYAAFPDLPRNLFYYIVYDTVSANPARQGFPFLLVHNKTANTWTEYRTIPSDWEWMAQQSYNASGPAAKATLGLGATPLIDLDGAVYFSISAGSFRKGTSRVNLNANPVIYSFSAVTQDTLETCGYDSRLGYFFTNSTAADLNGGNLKVTVRAGRDVVSGATKTMADVLNGNGYVYYVGRMAAVGLLAYLQETHIFIGGYFSIMPIQQLTLQANADNYVYFERDSKDRHKVNVLVKTKPMGITVAFSTALVAKITTDATKVVAQVNYPVAWDY